MKEPKDILKEYMIKKRFSPRQMAKHVGVSFPTIYKIIGGGKMNPKTACKIEKNTRNEIKYEDLVPAFKKGIFTK